MDLLGFMSGVVHGLKPLSMTQPPTAGFAFTVKQMPRHQEAAGERLTKHAQVIDELSSPGDVLVIDVGGVLISALAARYRRCGPRSEDLAAGL
jgi:regulator of RNase E activity RraA